MKLLFLTMVMGILSLFFIPMLENDLHLIFSSLFIFDLYGRKEPYPLKVHKLGLQGTKDQQYNHNLFLLEFKEEHNQMYRNKFFFAHHKQSPNQNRKACTLPKYN
jgi:hypothetical protein